MRCYYYVLLYVIIMVYCYVLITMFCFVFGLMLCIIIFVLPFVLIHYRCVFIRMCMCVKYYYVLMLCFRLLFVYLILLNNFANITS